MKILVTLLMGIIGSKIAQRLKVPGGAMIGALFSVAIFNILTGMGELPIISKIIVQILTGIFIGARITTDDIKDLKKIFIPSFLMIVLMGIVNFIMGYFIYKFTPLDMVTALFATAPGGLTDMTIISYDFGAEPSKVALLQMVRLISVIALIPSIIKLIIIKFRKSNKNIRVNLENTQEKKEVEKSFEEKNKNLSVILITLIIGVFGGILGKILEVPSGPMTFSMIATAIYNIFSNKAYLPTKLREFIQIIAGTLIGVKMNLEDVISLKDIIAPVIIVVIGFCIMNLILGFMVYKITNFNVETSLFATSPGGMTDISIIASELGADTSKVATMQFFRLISVITIYPIIINYIKNYFI